MGGTDSVEMKRWVWAALTGGAGFVVGILLALLVWTQAYGREQGVTATEIRALTSQVEQMRTDFSSQTEMMRSDLSSVRSVVLANDRDAERRSARLEEVVRRVELLERSKETADEWHGAINGRLAEIQGRLSAEERRNP